MRYLVLVSHGTFAPGLHSVLEMLAGEREDVLSTSLENGMGADEYVERVRALVAGVGEGDEVILLGDIVGGSPLTNALNVLAERGLLSRTRAIGGMNLPMAMTALMTLQAGDVDALVQSMLAEARDGAREIEIAQDDEDEDDI